MATDRERWQARALTAESSLSRIKEEAIGALGGLLSYEPIVCDVEGSVMFGKILGYRDPTVDEIKQRVKVAIRSLGSTDRSGSEEGSTHNADIPQSDGGVEGHARGVAAAPTPNADHATGDPSVESLDERSAHRQSNGNDVKAGIKPGPSAPPVPDVREVAPTDAMIVAGDAAIIECLNDHSFALREVTPAQACYRAMMLAASDGSALATPTSSGGSVQESIATRLSTDPEVNSPTKSGGGEA